ncbi:MAG: Creatininase [Paenibacillus sp.]|jgi:creatinine amidohydrolase|nr:Creatininase [Paenibacillus sp.]
MQWEHLSTTAFAEARQQVGGVCLLPFGVLESHGPHLPLGTDIIEAKTVAIEAAKLEPAIVFPGYYIGQLAGAQHMPGNICVRHDLLLQMMDEICREIARNGLKKIIIVNAHGGNTAFVQFFLQSTLQQKKDYIVYSFSALSSIGQAIRELQLNTDGAAESLSDAERQTLANVVSPGAHAGFGETAMVMGVDEQIVHLERKDEMDFSNRGRLSDLEQAGLSTWMAWYGKYPNNYSGDPAGATANIGKAITRQIAQKAAHAIRLVKQNDEAFELQNEFFASW